MNVRAMLLTLMLLATAMFAVAPAHGAVSGMHIEGPTVAAINTTISYKVSISSIFDSYRCTLIMGGQNLTGASPVNQVIKNSTTGNFVFQVKTPSTPQRIYLDFKAYGMMNNTQGMKIFERKIYVDVKNAYTIVTEIKNSEKYPVYNVTVDFYLDGRFIGNKTVSKINANSTAKVTYEWVPDVDNGPHKLEVKVSSTGVVFPNGKQSYVREIYVGNPPNYQWAFYLGIASAVALGVMFVLLFLRRGHGHRSEPKWKKS
jgi:hypothetical protein